jgi:hypothetical protein
MELDPAGLQIISVFPRAARPLSFDPAGSCSGAAPLREYEVVMRNRHERRKAKSHTKRIMLNGSDITNMVDAVFFGVQDDPGWVEMYADAKGRECIDAIFPKAHIAWKDDCPMPREWRAFSINVPDVIAATETRLPLEITRGANLDEATPDALACLLAMGMQRQGGCCAAWRGDHLEIYVPQAGN